MAPKVRLYIRPTLPDGNRPYLDPIYSANHKLRPGYALLDGCEQRFQSFTYYLRYLKGGKRVWENVGSDPQQALAIQVRREKYLDAVAAGAISLESENEPAPAPASKLVPPSAAKQHPFREPIAAYLVEIKNHKAKKTHDAYRATLERFQGQTERGTLEDVTRADIQAYILWEQRGEGNSARTAHNRACFLRSFFRYYDLPFSLANKDFPRYTEKQVRAYSLQQVQTMLAHADEDEADLIYFLICTGAREQDAQFACWTDVDLDRKKYSFTEHLDLGFRPKDREEGTVPIADVLVERLKSRRKRYPHSRLIFPLPNGKSNGHFLRILKRLAFEAGLNCGQCTNRKGQSCADHPVCRHILLHKMRKTFASQLSKNNVPVRTIMRYLRHSDLETTMKYLADEDDDQLRETVNRTFATFGGEHAA